MFEILLSGPSKRATFSRGYGEGYVPGRPQRVLHGLTSMVAKVRALIYADCLFLILLGSISFMGPMTLLLRGKLGRGRLLGSRSCSWSWATSGILPLPRPLSPHSSHFFQSWWLAWWWSEPLITMSSGQGCSTCPLTVQLSGDIKGDLTRSPGFHMHSSQCQWYHSNPSSYCQRGWSASCETLYPGLSVDLCFWQIGSSYVGLDKWKCMSGVENYSPWAKLGLELVFVWSSYPGGSDSKKSACSAGDLGLILGLGRSPGEGNGNPPQYSWLGNPKDRGAWQAAVHGVVKSQTWMSN